MFGYSIGKNARIGKIIINCNKVIIGDDVYIAGNNLFFCNELAIGEKTSIHSGISFREKPIFQ